MINYRILIALTFVGRSAAAQLPAGVDQMTPAAVAESLAVLKTLAPQLRSAPDDAALHYRAGRLALAILTRTDTRSPEMAAMPAFDRMDLKLIASDALARASELQANNVEYMLTWATYLEGASQMQRELALKLYDRVRAIVAADPDPVRRGDLHYRVGQSSWFFYNKFRLDFKPMQGFVDDIPDKPSLEKRPPPPEWGGTILTTRPQPMPTGAGVSDVQATSAAAREAMLAATRPELAIQNTAATSVLKIGPQNVSQGLAADYIAVSAPLPRILAVATRRAIERLTKLSEPDIKAELHYLEARAEFEKAYTLLPTEARTWRAVAMTRAEHDLWPDLHQFADDRTKRAPDDPWGWFALGLARQRLNETANARLAFDSGLARMTETERTRVNNVARLLRPSAVQMYRGLDSASRANYDAASWMLADPLWSDDNQDPRVEFLARIAHAELMWGSLSPRVYGADTPDGQRFVRYGPPVKRLNNILLYPGGLIFAEGGQRAELKAAAGADAALVRQINEWQPARWDNISRIDIDSMPVQTARFRIAGDSVDLFLVTRAPIEKLDSVAPSNVSPFAKFWLHGWNSPFVERDSISLTRSGMMQWTRRLPAGAYNYRVEATVPGTLAAGRAASDIIAGTDTTTGFAMFGFGMSDLLLASSATMASDARRWRDVDFVPSFGNVASGGQISIVWENYEVGRRGNSAEYHVTMTLLAEELFAGKMSMNILAGITSAIKRQDRSNRSILDFDRIVPYAPTIVDNLTLSFGDTQAGSYVLTVAVTDKVSGRTTARTTRIVIRDK